MRISLIYILIFLIHSLINAQEIKLLELNITEGAKINCDVIQDCIGIISFKKDTFKLTFTTNNLYYHSQPQLSFTYRNDTLKIKYDSPQIIYDTVIYNENTKKYEERKYISYNAPIQRSLGPKCRIFYMKFTGLKDIPKYIFYNGELLDKCPTTNIDYKIYNGDTINIIDRYGFKHGIWLEFYDAGQILNKRIYKHGKYIEGFQYDRNGQVIHRLYEKGTMIIEEEK